VLGAEDIVFEGLEDLGCKGVEFSEWKELEDELKRFIYYISFLIIYPNHILTSPFPFKLPDQISYKSFQHFLYKSF
jgi:hypothetical protein